MAKNKGGEGGVCHHEEQGETIIVKTVQVQFRMYDCITQMALFPFAMEY